MASGGCMQGSSRALVSVYVGCPCRETVKKPGNLNPKPVPGPKGPRTQIMGGPKYYNINGIWALIPIIRVLGPLSCPHISLYSPPISPVKGTLLVESLDP